MAERMIRSTILILALTLQLTVAVSVVAQETDCAQGSRDLNAMVSLLIEASRGSDFEAAQPDWAQSLEESATLIDLSGAGSLTFEQVAQITASQGASYKERLRWNREALAVDPRYAQLSSEAVESMLADVLSAVNWPGEGLKAHLKTRTSMSQTERDKIFCPVNEFHEKLLVNSLEASFEILRRYEVKFGPKSARLNWAEAAINAFAARAPGFGPDERGWPGPWEIVTAYSSSYVGIKEEEAQVTSVLELGLRHYNFTPGWGENDRFGGLLKPSYFSLGAVVSGNTDGALVAPWRGEERWGAFAAWGSLKVAYLLGDGTDRFLVSKQFQFLPTFF
jgi:hypothetical protein